MTTPDEFTPNYNLYLPKNSDLMSDVKKNITDNFKKISDAAIPFLVTPGQPLPQSGAFEIGDRVFRNDPMNAEVSPATWPSSYILVVKDDNWGWVWRPIQNTLAPWINVPATAVKNASWQISTTHPFQITMDTRGRCHWRGAINIKTGTMAQFTNYDLLQTIPELMRPSGYTPVFSAAVTPIGTSTGIQGYSGSKITLNPDGTSVFRSFYNATSTTIWLESIFYTCGKGYWHGT